MDLLDESLVNSLRVGCRVTKEELNKTTKEKILEVANDLFAKNGFSGTSIREIASGADVNIAAINYHFKNKESLYWRVFEFNFETIKNGVHESGERTENTADLAIDVYRFFMSSESAMMNIFKMFLSDSVAVPQESFNFEDDHPTGPPGQDVFLEKIKKDLGDNYAPESYRWAIKMIFSLLVHFGVVMNTSLMKKRCREDKDLAPESIENFIRHSVNAHLSYLKSNPDLLSIKNQ